MKDQVFISYSHKDDTWRVDLETHLKPYLRNGSITTWSDRQIRPGSKWEPEIDVALTNARIAVLLVSPDFFNSDFIHEKELGPLLKRAEEGGVKILWIPIRYSAYKQTPLREDQALSNPAKPLATIPKAKRDKVWVDICEKIEKEVSAITAPSDPLSEPHEAEHKQESRDSLSPSLGSRSNANAHRESSTAGTCASKHRPKTFKQRGCASCCRKATAGC